MTAADGLTAEFGGYKRSVESVDRSAFLAGDRSVVDIIKVFISYADQDRVMKDELRRSLAVLEAEKTISLWDRGDLLGGQRSEDVVRENLELSRIVLLLISSDFMADDGCCKFEMDMAMERLEFGIVHVVPIRLRSVNMGNSRLKALTWLPEKLVAQSVDKDAAFTAIADGIVKICDDIQKTSESLRVNKNNEDSGVDLPTIELALRPTSLVLQTPDQQMEKDNPPVLNEASIGIANYQHGESMNILHLSDLHFGNKSNASNWYSQLAEDLKSKLGCRNLDLIILSGDIANKSTLEEYEAAEVFVESVRSEFSLDKKNIIIVPGNHDLNHDLSRHAYSPQRTGDYSGFNDGNPDESSSIYREGDSHIEVLDSERYKQRFERFSEFYQAIRGDIYPLDALEQAIIYHFPERNLLILGLNSAWQIDHNYKSRVSIFQDALSQALDQIRNSEIYEKCMKFAVWHHPVISNGEDRIKTNGFMKRLALSGFSVAFHGHIHKAEAHQYSPEPVSEGGAKIHIICAGTFGAITRHWQPGYPLQYNFLKLCENKITVNTRCRREVDGIWNPDSIWEPSPGEDPLPRYEIILPEYIPLPNNLKKKVPEGVTPAIETPEYIKGISISNEWNKQIESDISSGKMKKLADKAIIDHGDNKTSLFPAKINTPS
jgi:3',5'-cyclic AMP phosphodiesterase CpdA